MQEHFSALQKRIQKNTLIICLTASASAALLFVSGILLFCKRMGYSPLFCLIGVAAFPIVFSVLWMLLKKDERLQAKHIDQTYDLKEQAQTMIAYMDSTEPMAVYQREDTKKRLGEVPKNRLKISRFPLLVVCLVLALSVFVTALVVPAKEAENVPDDPSVPQRELSAWEWQSLDELIEWVERSSADPDVMKPKTLAALRSLRDALQRGVSEDSFVAFVTYAMGEIGNAKTLANQQEGISDAQKEINVEVETYVLRQLSEIFGLQPPASPSTPEESEPSADLSGNTQSGSEVVMGANDTLFIPGKGYVKYQEVVDTYYEEVNRAFHEGTLSREEWRDFMITYFQYLIYGFEH